ncbi:hypothetical protein NDU88_001492 [Pleurodeles waltl]|uniref:Uncharacterized protein n=1 Tax=Pleurodeles waltl TaxID=8319 RepID=A0AAV7KSZ4_PLEWA|nr:hypothetical protein NDU88_001492 [Pleurodeles waltl]
MYGPQRPLAAHTPPVRWSSHRPLGMPFRAMQSAAGAPQSSRSSGPGRPRVRSAVGHAATQALLTPSSWQGPLASSMGGRAGDPAQRFSEGSPLHSASLSTGPLSLVVIRWPPQYLFLRDQGPSTHAAGAAHISQGRHGPNNSSSRSQGPAQSLRPYPGSWGCR